MQEYLNYVNVLDEVIKNTKIKHDKLDRKNF